MIKPLEPFEVKGVAGGCRYRFRIGERFLLRRHKGGKNKNEHWYSTFSDKYWFDVRYPGRENFEGFKIYPCDKAPPLFIIV